MVRIAIIVFLGERSSSGVIWSKWGVFDALISERKNESFLGESGATSINTIILK